LRIGFNRRASKPKKILRRRGGIFPKTPKKMGGFTRGIRDGVSTRERKAPLFKNTFGLWGHNPRLGETPNYGVANFEESF